MTPYWESKDGRHVIYCGDCLDVLPTLGKVDAVVTDPPYGLDWPYLSYDDSVENLKLVVGGAIGLARISASRVAVCAALSNLWHYPPADWVVACTWNTTGTCGKYGFNQWFPVLCYGEDRKGFASQEGTLKSDALQISGGGGVGFMRDDSEVEHPCPKPGNIMRWLVTRFSERENVVCDPFMGSGTTGVACIRTGRRFIGIEIEPKYCDIAVKRMERELSQLRLFEPEPPPAVQGTMFENK